MEEQKTLLLIDGHALAFREYYALERTNMRTNDGTPTWAVYGFFKALFDLLKKQKPDAIGVAFDVSHQTFRVEKYKNYKANRVTMPDNMKCQMDFIYEGLRAFNIPIYTKEGFEADDVIGTISKQACELGHKVLILTGDQDSFQLVDKNGCIKIIIPTKGELIEYDWEKVYEKLGVYPDQVIDYKSLRGDISDNIPGIKGVGEKTAKDLLTNYKHLQNIIDNCETIEPIKLKNLIANNIEIAKLSYFLATIVLDVDIKFDFECAKVDIPDLQNVTEFLKKLQFFTFLKNINSILTCFGNEIEIKDKKANNVTQLGLFSQALQEKVNQTQYVYKSKIVKTQKDLDEFFDIVKTKNLISFKTEGSFENAAKNTAYGIAISYNDDFVINSKMEIEKKSGECHTFYFPLNDNVQKEITNETIINVLRLILENDKIKKITHDLKQEYNYLNSLNIKLDGVIFDTYLASYVNDMSRNHTLSVQSLENLNHIMYDAINGKATFLDIPINEALDYVSDTAVIIYELTNFWLSKLSKKERKLLFEVELPLSKVLSEMELSGISLDVKYLTQLSKDLAEKCQVVESKIFELADDFFNLNSPKQVGYILYDKLNLQVKNRNANKKHSTSAEVLEELAQKHEIARLILEYRKYMKLRTTYTDSLTALIESDNRVHTTYNQTNTVTGRLSSSNPNLQNIPVRTEYGNKIRKAFIPKDRNNSLILSADYSQIELRLLAHISNDENLIEAFKTNTDVHSLTSSKVFDVPIEEVTKEMRYKAKTVNFGIVYGQSKYGLAKSLGISNDEAQNFIDKYFETYPNIKKYMDNQIKFVEKNGYAENLYGRRRYLMTELNSSHAMIREFAKRAAINYPMQSSASDLIKMAMNDFAKRLRELNLKSKLIIQVHDELVVEVLKSELEIVKELVKTSMELNQPFKVPLLVDINTGETWQEI